MGMESVMAIRLTWLISGGSDAQFEASGMIIEKVVASSETQTVAPAAVLRPLTDDSRKAYLGGHRYCGSSLATRT
jgi:hypothetical protein